MKNLILIIFLFFTIGVVAQQVPMELELENAHDGKKIRIADYGANKGVVLIFTGHDCPYDLYYKDRIKNIEATYKSQGIGVVLINSYSDSPDHLIKMKKYANDSGFKSIAYLADKDQRLMTALEVSKTPEVILLQNDYGNMVIFYRGAIDNNPQVAGDVREYYLRDNIENLLNGRPASPAEISPTGCRIK